MSTTSCRACGGQVSWEAVTCPHCGDPNPTGKKHLCYCGRYDELFNYAGDWVCRDCADKLARE